MKSLIITAYIQANLTVLKMDYMKLHSLVSETIDGATSNSPTETERDRIQRKLMAVCFHNAIILEVCISSLIIISVG